MKLLTRLTGTLVCGLAGCSLAPHYQVPVTDPAGSAYREAGEWIKAQPADEQHRGEWWTVFNDPRLNSLEADAAGANQDLKAAFARLQQARAAARIARSGLFPQLSASASATRSRASTNSPAFPPSAEPVGNDFDLQADLSYEIDLWGRVRNIAASAKADQQASAADFAAVQLEIQAEVANQYLTLRAQDSQQALLDQTVADYTRALALTRNLYSGGAAALTDVAQAEAQLQTALTQTADTRLQRAQSEHALALLLGRNPSGFQQDANPLPVEVVVAPIDPGLPSVLLQRRPDVAAAERRVAAANAGIGVARAAYFPVFNLAAATGFDSTNAATWLSAPSRLWSVGPTGVLTVFDAGRHRAQSAQAHAVYDEQVALYRSTVLGAYREVEDALAQCRELERESLSESAAVQATNKALEQAQYRYRAGLVTYLEVATTENTALQARLSNVAIHQRRLSAHVLLIKALGGGWQKDITSVQDSPRQNPN